jgi:serine/threonine-protein kinase
VNTTNPEKIGRYKVLDRVGRGGMGVLYRGMDPVLDREVAIKVMLMDFSDDADQMRPRFYREARASAKLQHPNIVTVFEFAEEDNTPFIVMEFLRGTSLAARMNSPVPLSLVDKVGIVAQLCSALGYAHEQGVIHRDVKPANVFLLNDGTVKLLDFGIAKVNSSTLTREGDVLGSASYMSPEQVSGSDAIDGRCDVFSAGVLLYELLSGKKPFHAEQATGIIMKILHEDPPPLDQVVPGLPAQLVAAVNKAIAKKPADRFATANEFAKELQWIRKALQAMAESNDAMDETRFASPSEIRRFQTALEESKPVTSASASEPQTGTSAAVTGKERKWVVPAGIAAGVLLAVIVGFVGFGGGSSTSVAESATAEANAAPPASTTSAPSPASPAAAALAATPAAALAASETKVQVDSTPQGATITLNGQATTLTTPAAVVITGEGPHRIGLARRGFVTREAELTAEDLQRGSVSLSLTAAEPTMIDVSVASTYPVEVYSGARRISDASESHDLRVVSGTTLSVRSQEYLLNAPVRVEGRPVEYQTPALGYLTVLTTYETCNVRVGQRDLGYPPITRMPLVAGQHRVDIACPQGGSPQGQLVTVPPNETAVARIF